ncbi:hypothetical protein [Paraburkholderia sp. CNPSo 3076]|uniref:hypothetical protein n=1 Tax=Paraburkholderia sp. CNPSo 3076 TaxID=2940936 RepID=UPI00224D836F|nr:hypothetical protein [Paraburkholderia sp. CNPSo 3076]
MDFSASNPGAARFDTRFGDLTWHLRKAYFGALIEIQLNDLHRISRDYVSRPYFGKSIAFIAAYIIAMRYFRCMRIEVGSPPR